MDEQEFAALLRFVERRLNERGFGGIRDRISTDVRYEGGLPSARVRAFLDALQVEFALGSDEAVRRISERINRIATTDDGRPIAGVRVAITNDDFGVFGPGDVDLGVVTGIGPILSDLERLVADLYRDWDPA